MRSSRSWWICLQKYFIPEEIPALIVFFRLCSSTEQWYDAKLHVFNDTDTTYRDIVKRCCLILTQRSLQLHVLEKHLQRHIAGGITDNGIKIRRNRTGKTRRGLYDGLRFWPPVMAIDNKDLVTVSELTDKQEIYAISNQIHGLGLR